jgi:hypothetical protein
VDLIGMFLTDLWNDQIVDQDREGIFLVFVGFLGSFLFIRTSTRLMRSPKVPWWPGSVSAGDLHVHHLVFGIVLMLIAPTVAYGIPDVSPWWELTAVAFGIGAGLTFDEFALWLHLEDVYWSEEGRRSVDAVAIAAVFMGVVFLGAVPFELDDNSWGPFLLSIAGAVISVGTTVICFMKGRFGHGVTGLVFYPMSLYGALRLAKPGSPWAKRFYAERNPHKQQRADKRFRHRRADRFYDTLRTAFGGSPTEVIEARRRENGTSGQGQPETAGK